ncbi:uncharacterized protein LOC136034832 [Artemia franciscana]|uniref:Myb-like domain-containing protein n=1 Tax=Artemia franciscana TaxID=6661 RepID=A0AA88IL06_ARTSF|nr:hypothetical protein QYM36_003101 [Artemia franciscana]KAK2722787.1 hypothetical protein QYM36_003101 [Artemia franciscana]KAK2722788.1 hypothetical protein QYM36_003101 [Artemia franciscana]KAK2722789.1 hypothetical protein QYM36_003101 [Artemia franciscana]KAK2722790.1 hypothetical protein QYM36_003101 [Artemia franciscana]
MEVNEESTSTNLPITISKRKIKPPDLYKDNSLVAGSRYKRYRVWDTGHSAWTEEELSLLLKLLEKHGSSKVTEIEMIPNRTVEDVKRTLLSVTAPARHKSKSIRSYKRRSNLVQSVRIQDAVEEKAPVTLWLEKILSIGSGNANAASLSQALDFIAKYEGHPPPSECEGVDYSAIYRYLADLSVGAIPRGLNKETCVFFSNVLDEVTSEINSSVSSSSAYIDQIKSVDTWEHYVFAKKINLSEPSEKEIEEAKLTLKESSSERMKKIIEQPGCNPFKFDLNVLDINLSSMAFADDSVAKLNETSESSSESDMEE